MFHGFRGINIVNMIIATLICFLHFSALGAGSSFETTFFQAPSTSQAWWRNGAQLDLDFVTNKYYLNGVSYSNFSSFITAAGATYTRASTAWFVNSSGLLATAAIDIPRFDYDPMTLAPKGLLIEEASTNHIQYSSVFGTSPWVKTSAITITPNAATAPDGTITASLISANGTVGSYFLQTGLPSVASQTVTRSVYVKAGTASRIFIEFNDGTYKNAAFDLTAKTATFTSGTASLIQLGSGWFRAVATYTYSASGIPSATIYIGAYGVGTGNMYLWGAQMEFKPFASSYIPTTNASASRSADVFSIPTSGWYNSTIGTFLGWAYGEKNSTQPTYGRILGGDSTKGFLGYHGSFNSIETWNGTDTLYTTGTVTASKTRAIKMAMSWDQGTGASSASVGSAALTNGTFTGNWNTTNIYPGGSNNNPLNACIRRITYFATKMSDAYLKDVTR